MGREKRDRWKARPIPRMTIIIIPHIPPAESKGKGIPAMMFCDGPRGVVCGTGKNHLFSSQYAAGSES